MSIYPNNFYVYFYLRDDYTPYYVGKGKGNRAYDKCNRSLNLPKDKSRIIILHDNLTETYAFILERYYIKWFGRKDNNTGILRNLTDGGEGCSGMIGPNRGKSLPEEWKQKMRKPKKLSYYQRQKMVDRMKGKEAYNKNKSKYYYISPKGEIFNTANLAAKSHGYKSKTSICKLCGDPQSNWKKIMIVDYLHST